MQLLVVPCRKGQTQSNTAGFDVADFMVALVHVAHVRCVIAGS
jgi:hypothetical protein